MIRHRADVVAAAAAAVAADVVVVVAAVVVVVVVVKCKRNGSQVIKIAAQKKSLELRISIQSQ